MVDMTTSFCEYFEYFEYFFPVLLCLCVTPNCTSLPVFTSMTGAFIPLLFVFAFLPFAFPPLLGGTDGGASLSVPHSAQYCSSAALMTAGCSTAPCSLSFSPAIWLSLHLSPVLSRQLFVFYLVFLPLCLLHASHCWFSGLFRCPIASRRSSLYHPCQSLPPFPSFVLCLFAPGPLGPGTASRPPVLEACLLGLVS